MSIHIPVSRSLIENSDFTIVDIRTEPEWKQTGIIQGSHLITFFDVQGNYDAKAFLKQMDELAKDDKEIALICRTGNRTGQVANFMVQQGYNVKNLDGGVVSLANEGFKFEPYQG